MGAELSGKTIKRALDELVAAGEVVYQGERRWRRYWRGSKGQTVAESGAKASRDSSPPAQVIDLTVKTKGHSAVNVRDAPAPCLLAGGLARRP